MVLGTWSVTKSLLNGQHPSGHTAIPNALTLHPWWDIHPVGRGQGELATVNCTLERVLLVRKFIQSEKNKSLAGSNTGVGKSQFIVGIQLNNIRINEKYKNKLLYVLTIVNWLLPTPYVLKIEFYVFCYFRGWERKMERLGWKAFLAEQSGLGQSCSVWVLLTVEPHPPLGLEHLMLEGIQQHSWPLSTKYQCHTHLSPRCTNYTCPQAFFNVPWRTKPPLTWGLWKMKVSETRNHRGSYSHRIASW